MPAPPHCAGELRAELRSLTLSGNPIGIQSLRALSHFPKLEHVYLDGVDLSPTDRVEALVRALPEHVQLLSRRFDAMQTILPRADVLRL